jgi:N-acetylglutamate synthase-like GNAT family acetyltransferase
MITIEPYSSDYQEQVVKLILSIQQDEFAVPISIADQPDLLKIPEFYQQRRGNFWIARAGNQVVGTIALLDIGHNWGVLRKMFVHKDYRGKHIGCGYQLLDTLLAWVKNQGMTAVYLGTIERFKAAHRFYEKNGFVEIAQTELPENFPQMKTDTKFYRYDLEERWED